MTDSAFGVLGASVKAKTPKANIIVSEIVQGLRRHVELIEHPLSQWEMLEPIGFSTYREAAAIFRLACAKGFSLNTIDTMIAAIALAPFFSLSIRISHASLASPASRSIRTTSTFVGKSSICVPISSNPI